MLTNHCCQWWRSHFQYASWLKCGWTTDCRRYSWVMLLLYFNTVSSRWFKLNCGQVFLNNKLHRLCNHTIWLKKFIINGKYTGYKSWYQWLREWRSIFHYLINCCCSIFSEILCGHNWTGDYGKFKSILPSVLWL